MPEKEASEVTNNQRSARALGAIVYYKSNCLYESGPAGSEEDVIDILTDLRHYCKQQGLSFGQAINTSEINFNEEV